MTYIQRIPELPGAGRLGRHAFYDPRRAAYPYQVPVEVPVTSRTWTRHIGILDQGNVGSCTGNALVGALGTDPLVGALPNGHPALNETEALRIYSEAEIIDGDGPYPPNDNGSTGQSVCKAAKNDGLISGYTWCQDETGILAALMAGPVGLGINWYSSFDSPDPEGIVSLPATAAIRGGHEIVAREVDVTRQLIGCDNSWGTGWGMAGRFYLPYVIVTRLMAEDGDCVVPLPLTAPAPVPVPPPGPAPTPDVHIDAADRALKAAIPPHFLTGHHPAGSDAATVARAITAWERAKGPWPARLAATVENHRGPGTRFAGSTRAAHHRPGVCPRAPGAGPP